jgi:hypothetical protein
MEARRVGNLLIGIYELHKDRQASVSGGEVRATFMDDPSPQRRHLEVCVFHAAYVGSQIG